MEGWGVWGKINQASSSFISQVPIKGDDSGSDALDCSQQRGASKQLAWRRLNVQ